MLDSKKRAEMDQALAALSELLPPAWRAIYLGCIKNGFSAAQSMDLVKTYILGQAAGEIIPPKSDGNEEVSEDH